MARPKGDTPNGEVIKELRSNPPFNMRQEDFATYTDLSIRKIQDIEAGKPTSRRTMVLIAEKLRVPVERLIGDTPNGEVIAKLRGDPPFNMTQEMFAQSTSLSVKQIQDIEEGKPTSRRTLTQIAERLNVPVKMLIVAERVIMLPGKIEDMTEAEMAARYREIHKEASLKGPLNVMTEENCSIKVIVRLSLEDAEKLDDAFRNGKLTGVLSVAEPPVAPESEDAAREDELSYESSKQLPKYIIAGKSVLAVGSVHDVGVLDAPISVASMVSKNELAARLRTSTGQAESVPALTDTRPPATQEIAFEVTVKVQWPSPDRDRTEQMVEIAAKISSLLHYPVKPSKINSDDTGFVVELPTDRIKFLTNYFQIGELKGFGVTDIVITKVVETTPTLESGAVVTFDSTPDLESAFRSMLGDDASKERSEKSDDEKDNKDEKDED